MNEQQYCAFISYRHQTPDQEIAKALHTAIETYGIPAYVKKKTGRKKMGKVFRDQEELPLSSNLGADIEAALDRSEYFIAICSPRYLESKWCLREMEYFIEHKGRDHVLTVLVEGEPADSFPEMIRYEVKNGERVETEPLAADVRAEDLKGNLKKLKNEKLRILAPMLGLSYDDLKRRARQRRIRIISTVSAAAFAAASITTSYLIINHERQEALKREVELNAQIAAEQTKLAEDNAKLAEEKAQLAEDNAALAEEQKKIADEQTKIAASNAKLAEEQTKLAEDTAKLLEEQTKLTEEQTQLAEDNAKLAEDNAKLAEDQKKIADEKTKVAEEQTKLAEDNAKLAAEQTQLAEDTAKLLEEQKKLTKEQTKLAEDNAALAEERRIFAEEQHELAISNEIGEMLERADGYLENNERIAGAEVLLEALTLSDGNGQVRRDEILTTLRKAVYCMPFAAISGFENENVRMTDMVVSPDRTKAIGVENMNSVVMLDFTTGEIVNKVSTGSGMIVSLDYSPDSSRFIGNYATHATVWDAETGEEVFTYRPLNPHGGEEYDIAHAIFWRDADTMLVMDWDTFYFVSIPDGSMRKLYTMGEYQEWFSVEDNIYTKFTGRTIDDLFTMHTDGYTGVDLSVSKDWSRIMIGGRDAKTGVLVIDEEGNLVCPLYADLGNDLTLCVAGSPFDKIAISPDGKTAVWVSMLGFYVGWDVETGWPLLVDIMENESNPGGTYTVSEICFTPDSSRFVFTAGSVLKVYDARSGEQIINANLDDNNQVPAIKFTDDGKYMLLNNESLFIIDANTYDMLMVEQVEDARSTFTAEMDLQDTFFTTRNDGSVTIYAKPEAASIQRMTELPSPMRVRDYYPGIAPEGASELHGEHTIIGGFWKSVEFPDELLETRTMYSRDGSRAAILYPDGWIELFDTYGDGTPQWNLGQIFEPIAAFAMVNDRLVASSSFGRLLFWDLENNRVLKVVKADTTYTGFAFNESGDLMMGLQLGSGAIDVYNMKNAELLFTITNGAEFTEFGFSEDGEYAIGVTTLPSSNPELNGTPCYMVADLYMDETKLIEHARDFAALAE